MMDVLSRLFWLAWSFICTVGAIEAVREGKLSVAIACYVVGAALAFSLATRHD